MSDTYSNFEPDLVQRPPPGPQPGPQPPAVQQPPAQPVSYQPPGPGAPQFPMVAPLANLVRGFFPQPRPQQEQFTRLDEPRDQPTPTFTTPWSQPGPGEWRPPYIPVRPRSAREAGGEWWPISGANNYPGADAGPMLPSPREAVGVMGHAGRWLQQWGSPSVSPFMGRASQMAMQLAPILDMLSKGAFSKNYMQARMGQFKLMQDEMLMNAQMGLQQHQKELMDYSDVFRAFDAGALGATPEKNAQEAHRQLEELAQSHPNLLAILKNKGVGAMERAVAAEDAQYRNMYAGFTSAKKARDDAGGENVFEGDGAAGGNVSGMGQREDPLALKPDVKAPGPVAEDTSAVPATSDAATASDRDKIRSEIAKKHGNLNTDGMEKAIGVVNGTVGSKELKALPYGGGGAVSGAAAEIANRTQNILSDPTLGQDEKLKRIDALNPQRAATLRGLLDYSTDPKTFSTRSTGPGNRGELIAQAGQINPKYNESNFATIDKFKRDNLPKLAATATMAQSMIQVYKALKEFKEGETYPRAVLNQLIDNKYLRDDKYARLYQAVNDYAINTAMVQGGGSQARVTLVKNLLQHMDATASPWQIRSQMDVDTNGAYARVQALNDQWRSMTGRTDNVPGFLESSDRIITAFKEHVNKKTGQVDINNPNVPDEVKALNKIPSPQDRPYGRTKADERPPLPQGDIDRMKKAIEDDNRGISTGLSKDTIQRFRELLSAQGVY